MEALQKAVDELGTNMNKIMTDLEPRIKGLEAAGKGNAEIKETVEKMSTANAELVDQIGAICPEFNRHPASVSEARNILGL